MTTTPAGADIHWEGSEGSPILFVGGPPTSARLFRGVQARLRPWRTGAVELVGGPRVDRIEDLVDRLAAVVVAAGPRALVAHGLAVPLALRLPGVVVPHRILSNGPLTRLHPVMGALVSLPRSLWQQVLLRPGLSTRWLASSAALRRTVVNPYVMEAPTVEALTAALVRDPAARANTATWVAGLGALLPAPRPTAGRVDAVWGDRDRLHPVGGIEAWLQSQTGSQLRRIPGGAWHHPEERAWALADQVRGLLEAETTT